MLKVLFRILALLVAGCGVAVAAQTVLLPGWVCTNPDTIFAGAFEPGENAVPHDASGGSGGLFPGNRSRSVQVANLGSGTQVYFLYMPNDYTPSRAWPLVIALHGVAPYAGVLTYARAIRNDWATVAATGHFIVAAPVANDVIYDSNNQPYAVSWLTPPTAPNDYDMFAAIRADIEGAYNIERTRIYGWGFSAGGHVMHDLGVTAHSSAFNASTLAAYSVSAGDLAGLACASMSSAACDQLLDAVPRKVPVDIHIGTSDPNFTLATDDYNRFVADGWSAGQSAFYSTFTGGHTYSTADLQIAWANLCPNAVIP